MVLWRLKYYGRQLWSHFTSEEGVGVVEIILILLVLIGLVLIFKTQMTTLVQKIFKKIFSESAGI